MTSLYCKEMETSLLGMLMVDSSLIADCLLAKTDFGTVDHQLIYKAIASVYEEHNAVDPILVAKELDKMGELNRVGGSDYIYQLQAPIVETESAPYYIHEILKMSLSRQTSALFAKAQQRIEEGENHELVSAEITEAIQEMESIQKGYEGITAKELENMEIPPAKWFIPDMLCEGLTILAGPPKIGKSYFCWNMALAIACGGMVFSEIELEAKHNVSYLSFEDSPALLKERLPQISNIMPANLHIVTDISGSKFDALGLGMLKKHVDEVKSEVVFVDTWAHVSPAVEQKGTAYDIEYEMLKPVQRFAHEHNIALILVTHTRKAVDMENSFNRIQGSTAMQAGCDTLMMLSHDSGSKTLHISGRRILSDQLAFTMDDGVWCLEGNAVEYHKSELRKEIKSLLIEAGNEGLSYGDIKDLTGKNDSHIKVTLRRMVKDDEIEQPKIRGKYFSKDEDDDISL